MKKSIPPKTASSSVDDESPRRIVKEPTSPGDVATTVAMAVAEFLEKDPETMYPPLYDQFDPDALNCLFGSGSENSNVEVTMSIQGARVVVRENTVLVTGPQAR